MTLLRWLVAIPLLLNALFMLGWPHAWYHAVPGVIYSGPLNEHFVRDIGCAYLVSALGLMWRARSSAAWPAALSGAVFLLMHGLVHVADLIAGRCGPAVFLGDAPGVFGPAFMALWLAWPERPRTKGLPVQAGYAS